MTKRMVITGASSGIGWELAKQAALQGYNIVAVARSYDKLSKLKLEIETGYDCSVEIITKDLTAPGTVIEVYKELQNKKITIRRGQRAQCNSHLDLSGSNMDRVCCA